jgi:hypothetical protein
MAAIILDTNLDRHQQNHSKAHYHWATGKILRLCRNMYLPERHNLLPFHTYDIALGRQLLHAPA